MKVFKLFRQRRDGTLGPLFINARQRVPVGEWLDAEDHPTRGFAHRPGWHATIAPTAPHLKSGPGSGRVWCECTVGGHVERFRRPESQGGTWILAERLRVDRIIGEEV